MSYQYSSQGLSNFTPTFTHDFQQIYTKNYSNSNYNQASIIQNKQHLFDYEIQKAFISKQKQWLNSLKNPQLNHVHNVIGNTITKPNSSSLAQHKRSKVGQSQQFEQNLAKTVKLSVVPYKRVQPQINPQYFKASSIYGEPPRTIQQSQNFVESRASKIVSSNNGASQKQSIMSIDQIREVEKKQFSEKTIHKITSSASRNKLKMSSSKDSKGSSVNVQTKSIKLNGQIQRYNKYIKNELIDNSIDLRKEPPKNIIGSNLNVRKFGGSEPLQSQYQTSRLENYQKKPIQVNQIPRVVVSSQSFYPQNLPVPNLIQKKNSQNQELTCKDSVPREDKDLPQRIKTRSKSNLSMYSQLKQQNPHLQCLIHCEQKVDPKKSIQPEIIMYQTQEKSLKRQSLPLQKSQKKIHFVSYSSNEKNFQKAMQTNPSYYQNYQTETLAQQISKDSKRQEVQKILISFSGIKRNQQLKRDRLQTQRKSITNFNVYPRSDVQGESNGLSQLIEEKMKKKPLRLTLQKRN